MNGQESTYNTLTPSPRSFISSPLTLTTDLWWNNTYTRRRDQNQSLFQYLSSTSHESENNGEQGGESKDNNSCEELDGGMRHGRKIKINASNLRSDDIASTQKKKAMKLTQATGRGSTLESMTSIHDRLQKKHVEEPACESSPTSIVSETVNLAGREGTGPSRYNLRKGPKVSKYRSNKQPASDSCSKSATENNNELSPYNWNAEFPKSVIRADLRLRKKENVEVEVNINRRDTYWHEFDRPQSIYPIEDNKILVPAALEDPLNYVRSLARFTEGLGPVVQKVALRKLESILPSHDLSWVGKSGALIPPISVPYEDPRACTGSMISNPLLIPGSSNSTSDAQPFLGRITDDVRKLNRLREVRTNDTYLKKTPCPPVPTRPYPSYGFNTSRIGSGNATMPGALMADGLPPLPPKTKFPNGLPSPHSPSNSPTAQGQFLGTQVQNGMKFGMRNFRGMAWEEQQPQQENFFVPKKLTMKMNVRSESRSSSSAQMDSSQDQEPNLKLQL